MPKRKQKQYTKLPDSPIPVKEIIPSNCQRCVKSLATIRAVYFKEDRKEYICLECKLTDPHLKDLPVKPKNLSEAQKEILFLSLVVPEKCERCEDTQPQIRKFDSADNTIEFICRGCKGLDSSLKELSVKPKRTRKMIFEQVKVI